MDILGRKRKTPFEIEWNKLYRQEQKFIKKHQEQSETTLNRLLKEKVPEKLQETLDSAFAKAFALMFDKGTGIIEKTYNKEKIASEHKIDLYADEIYSNRKSLQRFSKKAEQSELLNVTLSGVSGIGMGLVGIGIPDIPVFTGIMLKSVYEIALKYGFSYDTDAERYFILLLIEGAVSHGESFLKVNSYIDGFIQTGKPPVGISITEQIKHSSAGLSKELLYMKFLQGIPIVGAVGGAYDVAYMKQISEYARIKYKKRFLLNYDAKQ